MVLLWEDSLRFVFSCFCILCEERHIHLFCIEAGVWGWLAKPVLCLYSIGISLSGRGDGGFFV